MNYLGQPDLSLLAEREKSRVFQAWAEMDPHRGLSWLRKAAESATDGDVRQLSGEPDGSGGWRGRRQVVWLCEHLACFAEHFWDCEAILFRLAQVETEKSICAPLYTLVDRAGQSVGKRICRVIPQPNA